MDLAGYGANVVEGVSIRKCPVALGSIASRYSRSAAPRRVLEVGRVR
jgi:hypothetical protein